MTATTVRTREQAGLALPWDLMTELGRHGMTLNDYEGLPDQDEGLSVHTTGGTVTVRVEEGELITLALTGVDGRVHPHPGNPFTDARAAALAVARFAHVSFTGTRWVHGNYAAPAAEVHFEACP